MIMRYSRRKKVEGKMVATVRGAMAEMERELIRERTMAGLARVKAKGKSPRKKSGYHLRWASKKTKSKYQGGLFEK